MAIEEPEGPGSSTLLIRLVFGLVQICVAIVLVILGIALVMGLRGTNPDGEFAAWIYARTVDLVAPFDGILDPIQITSDSVFRAPIAVAMAVYAIAGGIVATAASRFI